MTTGKMFCGHYCGMLSEINNRQKKNCLYIEWYGAQHVANLFWIKEMKQEKDNRSCLSAVY